MVKALKHRCVLVQRNDANQVLSRLLSERAVEETLKIKPMKDAIAIPIRDSVSNPGSYSMGEEEFEVRPASIPPQDLIREELESMGIDTAYIPERWVRIGSSVILNLDPYEDETKRRIAEVYARVLRESSIYEQTGRISGIYRQPVLNLLSGPGGDTIHLENGIRYILDPSKVMFSPGNVNVRTSVREINIRGKTVLDMFAGIGYFTLGIAKYSRPHKVHAVEINPESYTYLMKNIKLNKLENVVVPHQGDVRTVLGDIMADFIVMGNFMSFEYLPHALKRIRDGGSILMHDLVSTENLGSFRYAIQKRVRGFGFNPTFLGQSVVKSFAPHMWHTSIEISVGGI